MSKKLPESKDILDVVTLLVGGFNLEKVVDRYSGQEVSTPDQKWSLTNSFTSKLCLGYVDCKTGRYHFHTYMDEEEIPYILYVGDDVKLPEIRRFGR